MDPAWMIHQRQLDALVRAATRDLIIFARRNPNAAREDVQLIFAGLVDTYGLAAAESAMLALEDSRAAGGHLDLPDPVAAEAAPPAQVDGSFAWAAATTAPQDNIARTLAGPLGRLVRQPARDTVFQSTREAGTRWARIPGPKACWFCLMLASRGAAYHTRESASLVSTRSAARPEAHRRNPATRAGHSFDRGRPAGGKFHDNCSCQIVEVHDPDELPGYIADLYDEWVDVTSVDGMPASDQIQRWRKHIEATRPNGETVRPK